jgi:hypothetical protein
MLEDETKKINLKSLSKVKKKKKGSNMIGKN